MEYQLTVVEGPDLGKSMQVTGHECYLGRDGATCSLVLIDEEVSRKHAKVTVYDGGVIYIEDLGSSNGTFVNEEKTIGELESMGTITWEGFIIGLSLLWLQLKQVSDDAIV